MIPRPTPDATDSAPAIAVIGCGAIAEAFHVPALARHEDVRDRLVLVDPDKDRAREMALAFGISRTAGNHREILDGVDGAVVAAPHRLHVPITLDCVRAGVHVLCEKPLAERSAEVAEIRSAAEAAGVSVSVNNMRRLYPASRMVKELLEGGEIGRPTTFEYYQGEPFDWPAATDSYFGVRGSGKGVLLDLGAHVVDLACWWLGGKPELRSYRDDAMGGTEAVAEILFDRDGCEGVVRLSWLTRYPNIFRIRGEAGAIEGRLYDENSVTLFSADGRRTARRSRSRSNPSHGMIDAFLDATRGRSTPAVSAGDVAPSISLIEECYASRERFEMPWFDDAAGVPRS